MKRLLLYLLSKNKQMKKSLLSAILFLTIFYAFAQNQAPVKPKLSPFTRKFMLDQQSKLKDQKQNYLYKKGTDGKLYVSAVIKVSDAAVAQNGLNKIGAHVGTKAGKVWTVKVPADKVQEFVELAGIFYIQIDEPVKPHLNIVRGVTRVDSVQKGINLPLAYSGKNVVVGVIDFGFDYKHPTFYDTLGTRYRVKQVWELNGVGTPPAGYTYGREIKDTNSIKAADTDNPKQTHGTGVTGIAAGSGYGSPTLNTRYRGIAYDADIVFVGVRRDSIEQQWLEGGFSDFIDGISYIFNYAKSVNKPAVVNISWGSQSGPHDGNTLFNEACDNLTGSGRIIVMSAGNEGEEKIHLSKTFTPTDSLLNTFLTFTPATYKRTWVDVWGDTSKTFCGQVTLYSGGVAGSTTGMVCIDDLMHPFTLIGTNGDTCTVEIITSTSEFNGKPRMTLSIFNKAADNVCVTLKGTDGSIDAWNEYYYYGFPKGFQSAFSNLSYSWAQTGNTNTTVSDMGAGRSIVLVGAYASKISYTDINSNPWSYSSYVTSGKAVPFSSHGPMIDGRIKPDISAPGLTIATAYTSYDSAYSATGANSKTVVSGFTHPVSGKRYYYGEFTGTSASAPVVSGIVALMLQANPNLFPSHVLNIFAKTAITDTYTGTIPAEGNNTWGHGKVNAYGALKGAIAVLGVYNSAGKKLECTLYPNPNKGDFTLDYASADKNPLHIEIFNSSGSKVLSKDWIPEIGLNSNTINLSNEPQGIYIIRLSSDEGFTTLKMLID